LVFSCFQDVAEDFSDNLQLQWLNQKKGTYHKNFPVLQKLKRERGKFAFFAKLFFKNAMFPKRGDGIAGRGKPFFT